jgi:hypothetical protein
MEKRQTIFWAIVVLTSGAGLAYLYFVDYHQLWNPTGRPGELASTTDKSIGAPVTSLGAKRATFEDPWEVGRPINPSFSIDRDELLTDPTVPPLMRALDLGDMVLAKSLIAGGANVNAASRSGNTALMIAANRVELGALRQLLVSGAAVDARNADGLTALFYTDSPDIARELIEHGADVNATSRFNITPLMGVVSYDPPIVRLLIANRANVNARDVNGVTALMWAALRGRADNVKILVEAGADVNARDNKGGTAMSRVQWRIDTWSPEERELEVVTENKKQLRDFRVISKLLKRVGATPVGSP